MIEFLQAFEPGAGLGLGAVATWTFVRLAAKLSKLIDTSLEYLGGLSGHQKRLELAHEKEQRILTQIRDSLSA